MIDATPTLLSSQSKAVAKLRNKKVGALFMRPGTGKTRTAYELIRSVPGVDAVLWIGPLRTIHPHEKGTGVVDELKKWGDIDGFHFFGVESISASDRILLEAQKVLRNAKRPFIVVDESLKIKNGEAKRTQRVIELGKMAEYKLILNGTPVSRNLLDIWAQMEFLSPLILNMNANRFKRTFCEFTRLTQKLPDGRAITQEFITKYHNVDYLYRLISPFIFEADLELTIKQRHFDYHYHLTNEEKAEYDGIKERYLDKPYIAATKFLEMTQIMQQTYCVSKGKFELLERLFRTIPAKQTIIACKFIKSQEKVKEAFPEAQVLSLQKHSLGLNIQHCRHTVFWDKTWDWALTDQMMFRTWRTGQNEDCSYYHLHGNVGLEGMMRKSAEKKEKMVDTFKTSSLITEL